MGKDLQYSFKPYYNWNVFNTIAYMKTMFVEHGVLNLILTGIPSILKLYALNLTQDQKSFKPYSTGLLKCSSWLHK